MTESGSPGRPGELNRFAIDCALKAAYRTELWVPGEPDFGFIDYFEAAATRNLSLLDGFEDLADDIERRGILPPTDSNQATLVTDGGVLAEQSQRTVCGTSPR